MAIPGKTIGGQGGIKEKPEKAPPPKPKIEQKDTSIFGGRSTMPMEEVAWKFKKASPIIPNSGGAMLSEKERLEMIKELPKKHGGCLDKFEREKIIKDLEKEKYKAPTGAEKLKIDRKIRFFKRELFGK